MNKIKVLCCAIFILFFSVATVDAANWSGEYGCEADNSHGELDIKNRGSEYLVNLHLTFGMRGFNKGFRDLKNAVGKEKNGKLDVYNKNKHVFTLTRKKDFLILKPVRNLSEKDIFTEASQMQPASNAAGYTITKSPLSTQKDYDILSEFAKWEKDQY